MGLAVDEQLERIERGTENLLPLKDLRKKLTRSTKTGKPLKVKLGIDPSASQLHLGHAVVLKKLRDFQDLGHTAVLIVGDFTRRIGDPTGQAVTREKISEEEIKRNMRDYKDQAFQILDLGRCDFRYNSEWLGKLDFADIIELTSKYNVARMLEREDFNARFQEGRPISICEFLYPLAQAYDSIAIKADVELGGSDQWKNLLIGRDIQREYGQEPQVVVTVPLLEGTDGTKSMSQTEGNYIAVNEEPSQMYGQIMSLPDRIMDKYFRLLTNILPQDLKELHPKEKKEKLAWAIVKDFHSQEAADQAQLEFKRVFEQGEKPSKIPSVKIDSKLIKDDNTVWIVDLLDSSGLVDSRSEAKRLIKQGAVRLNDEKVKNVDFDPPFEEGMLLQIGKRRYARLVKADGDQR